LSHQRRRFGVTTPAVAILSDIHANRQALDAVLRTMRGTAANEWWCVGDTIDYGADPVYCARACLSQATRRIIGNHELAVTGRMPFTKPAEWVRTSSKWTTAALSFGMRGELAALEAADTDHEVPMFHGSPRDHAWEYVVSDQVARASLELVEARVTLVGHSHRPAAWCLAPDGTLSGGFVSGETSLHLAEGRWIINPGSVGQPRDGDARAAWAILDLDADKVHFRRTPYDVAAAQNAILGAGLPSMLADRLSHGR
jgi:predicted phosphodiesterase